MHNRVRLYISACFYYSGLVSLMRRWRQRWRPGLTILYYHQAYREDLRSQWLYLRRHYRILSLEAALEELSITHKKGIQRKNQRSLLALTFDDGYYDNFTHAFPVARELQVPITIFLIPGYIGSSNSFWWATRLVRLAQVEQLTWEGCTYHLDQQEERKALAQVIDARFSRSTSFPEREKFLASLCQMLSVPPSAVLKEEPAPLLTWTQVREMQESGWVSFGAHTIHHPDLGTLVDPAEVRHEVGECRTMLEKQLGHPVRIFAYPFGSIGDYGLGAVKQTGYDWAVTTQPGINTCLTDPHLLRRRKMDGNKHWLVVAAETAGAWGVLSRMKGAVRLLIRKALFLRHREGLIREF
ncbi:MAG TPA: polysaccharide deacetylase family protein [Ktedonobacteraceae bacterium]|nr:polysaccharide deacetylase family protein [Ktedonobacteraceae bacterium]